MPELTSRLYLAQTRRGGVPSSQLETLSEWMDAPILVGRPLPSDRAGMVFDGEQLRLHAPGNKGQLWHPGMAYRRIRWRQDALCRLLELESEETVLDCTLGMGHDALVMAHAGARVFSVEKNAAQLVYTAMGIQGYDPELARRIQFRRADMRTVLPTLADDSVDHVYIDPMFPSTKYEKHSQTWALLRQVHGGDKGPDKAVIREAIRVARRGVLIKLPPRSGPLHHEGLPKGIVVGSKRVQYAKWTIEREPSSA